MSSVVNTVRTKVADNCCVTRCRKEGCRVYLPNELRPFVVIDLDHPESPAPKDGKRCDFLFISDDSPEDWVVPMELKRGKATASEIVPQLQAGATIAQGLVPGSANVKFRPVAVYGGGLRRYELRAFKKRTVRFRKKRERVRLIKCGASLTQALHAS